MNSAARKIQTASSHATPKAETPAELAQQKPWYIEGRWYDSLLIVLSPLFAFGVILLFCSPRPAGGSFVEPVHGVRWLLFATSTIVFTHIMLVYARSHMNKEIFKRFPLRFTLVPIAVTLAMVTSNEIYMLLLFVSHEWDEIHTSMQTFGFGRIYDSRLGNDPLIGRKLDMGICFVLEYMPHIFLLSLLPIREFLMEVEWGDYSTKKRFAEFMVQAQIPMIVFGVGYLFYYIYRYSGFVRSGYKIAPAKIVLYGLTGLVNIVVVWKYTIFEAAILGNLYHAFQYFAIVWVSERKNLGKTLGTDALRHGKKILFAGLFGTLILLAVTRQMTEHLPILAAFWTMTSLMHFWYDGFIWSVRKKDI